MILKKFAVSSLLLAAVMLFCLSSCGVGYTDMEESDRDYILTFEEFAAEGEHVLKKTSGGLSYKFQRISDKLSYSARYSAETEAGAVYSYEVAVIAFRDDVKDYFENNPLKGHYTEKLVEGIDPEKYGADDIYLSAAADHFFLKMVRGRTMIGVIFLEGTADPEEVLQAAAKKMEWLSAREDEFCAERFPKELNDGKDGKDA